MTLHLSRLRRRRNQLICESTHNYTNLLTHTVASKCIRFVVVHLRSHLARTQPKCVCSLSLSLCLSLSLSFFSADSENEANKFFCFWH